MYNPLLDTFVLVTDCGSFTKAAERMYLSPTAVMKQMNTLETHLNLKLIERTPAGIRCLLRITMTAFCLKLKNWEKNLTF